MVHSVSGKPIGRGFRRESKDVRMFAIKEQHVITTPQRLYIHGRKPDLKDLKLAFPGSTRTPQPSPRPASGGGARGWALSWALGH